MAKTIAGLLAALFVLFAPAGDLAAQAKNRFTLGVSIYVGWMPWYYANETGILKKWATRYGITIDTKYMEYVASITAFTSDALDAVVMTNMDALAMPVSGGKDTSAVVYGDFSNGNDKVLGRDGVTLQTLKGAQILSCTNCVSEFVLQRGLVLANANPRDAVITETSDSDIETVFRTNKRSKVAVAWNPQAMNLAQIPGVSVLFDSSKIPGEVQDLLVVHTNALKADTRFAEALTGAWFETLAIMNQRGPAADAAIAQMAKLANTDVTAFRAQLATTAMNWDAKSTVAAMTSADLKAKMDLVRKFAFEKGMFGQIKSVDGIGIQYPDGTVQGSAANIKFRYDASIVKKALDGTLRK